ncbi:hypothetical protein H6G54_12075 [Anabaena cylindrica FACHB-243]|uniref:Uncharacterized protein n=1 Tax=Anabaena cylindrica (strain ATCC 27899 / PCC 7122) TaxID=272123 RepID=K9ZDU3_ANACC|nr:MULTISPECIES: hypothetical protein [Anabaena]AFZ56914.1 hypothetical protein Anacy_1403 [Anabaena cylindrica PCC 7122]MBD2418420.1 hypothetical protein [Anabaena cylindrica FACHB-243]MBY5284368.1 hypothetical protein [Anabaena sp. CCAP 1446/1C]MBY5307643.1 hypothetical protein [Anabaena sp. CCAP 1446/1C]MCM2409397.1 hypothetical protein [Anabaena sp. CCAP 1446/1C]
MIPTIPSFNYIASSLNQTSNTLAFLPAGQSGFIDRIRDGLKRLLGEQNTDKNTGELNRKISDLEKRLNQNYKDDRRQDTDINNRYGQLNGEIWSLRRDFNTEKLANASEHKLLWGAIGSTQKLVSGIFLGLPALVKSIVLSIIGSILLSKLIDLGMGLFIKNGKIDLSGIFAQIQAAKDDARAAATIAVKAEGKADKALTRSQAALENIKFLEKSALNAFKRLESFTRSELAFLTKSTLNALLRLQDRLATTEISLNTLKNTVAGIQKGITSQLDALKLGIEKIKADLLNQISNIKIDVGKLFGQAASLAAQIAGLALTIAGINALIRRFNPGVPGVVNVTNISNNFDNRITNNYVNNSRPNYITNTTNTANPVDSALLKKVDATTTANLALSANVDATTKANLALSTQIQSGVAFVSTKLINGFKWLQLDRVMNLLTFAVTVHNAGMLSQNILVTLTQAMQNVIDLIGVKDDANNPVQLSTLINSSISDFVKNVVGKENYDNVIKQWNYYNRIYQASANIFSSLLNMGDSITQGLQVIGGQTGKIGNALRAWGAVSEKAYGWFNPSPNFSNPLLIKLNNLEETASVVENVSQQPLTIKASKEEVEESSKALADSLAQEEGKPQGKEFPEAKLVKAEQEETKINSAGKDLSTPDLEPDED